MKTNKILITILINILITILINILITILNTSRWCIICIW